MDRYCLPETQKLLIGNKSDIPVASRQAEASKAQVPSSVWTRLIVLTLPEKKKKALARDCDNIPFLETSAKNNQNVDEVFMEMAKLIKGVKDRKKGIGLGS